MTGTRRLALVAGPGEQTNLIKSLIEELPDVASVTLVDADSSVDAKQLAAFDHIVAIVTVQMTSALAEALALASTIVLRPSTIDTAQLSGSTIVELEQALEGRETIVFGSPLHARAELRARLKRPATAILSASDEPRSAARERARALFQSGRIVDALAAYDSLLESPGVTAEDHAAAQLGAMLCLIANDNETQARERAAALDVSELSPPARLTAARAFALLSIEREAQIDDEQADEFRAFEELRSGSVPAARPKTADLVLQATLLLVKEKRFETAGTWLLAVADEARTNALVGAFFMEVVAALIEEWSWNSSSDSPLSHGTAQAVLSEFGSLETGLTGRPLDTTIRIRILRATLQVAMRTADLTKTDVVAHALDGLGAFPPEDDKYAAAVEAASRGDIASATSLLGSSEPEWRGRFQRIVVLFLGQQSETALEELLALADELPGVPIVETETARRLASRSHYDRARRHAESAFLLLPGNGQRLILGECLLGVGDATRAAEIVEPLAATDRRAHVLFAQALEKFDLPAALEQWSRYLEEVPSHLQAALHVSALYAQTGSLDEGARRAWQLVQARGAELPSPVLFQMALLQNAAPLAAEERLLRIREIHDTLRARGRSEDDRIRVMLWQHIHDRIPLPASDLAALTQPPRPPGETGADVEQAALHASLQQGLRVLYQWGHLSLESCAEALAPDPAQLVLRLGADIHIAAGDVANAPADASLHGYSEIQLGVFELLSLARFNLLTSLGERLGPSLQLRVFEDTPTRLLTTVVALSQEHPSEQLALARRSLATASDRQHTEVVESTADTSWVFLLRTDSEGDLPSLLRWLRDRGSLSVNAFTRAAAGLPEPNGPIEFGPRIGLRASALRWVTERDLLPTLSRAVGERIRVLKADLDELGVSIGRAQHLAEALALASTTHTWLGEQLRARHAHVVKRPGVELPRLRPNAIDAQVLSVGFALWARECLVDAPARCLVALDTFTRDVFSGAVFVATSLKAFDWTEPLYREIRGRYKPTASRTYGLAWLAKELAGERANEVTEELLSWGDSTAFTTPTLVQLWKDYPAFQGRAGRAISLQEAPLSETRHAYHPAAHFGLAKVEGQVLQHTLESKQRSAVYDGWLGLLSRWHTVSAPQKIWLLTFALMGLVDSAKKAFVPIPETDRSELSAESSVDAAVSALAKWSLEEEGDIVGHGITELLLTIDKHRDGAPTMIDLAPIVMLVTKAKPPADVLSLCHSWMEPLVILGCTWPSTPIHDMFETIGLMNGESLRITFSDVLARAVSLAEERPKELGLSLDGVQFRWPVSETHHIDAEVPLEAIVLSVKPAVATKLATGFAAQVGRLDGVLAELLAQLAASPTDPTLRRAVAVRAVESPARLVRHMPGLVSYWGRVGALPELLTIGTLEELRALLSEPSEPLSVGTAERLAIYLATVWKDRHDLPALGAQSAKFPGVLGWQWALRAIALGEKEELSRARWLLEHPDAAHFGELWWSIATEWLRATQSDNDETRQNVAASFDRVIEHALKHRELGRLEAQAVGCVRSVVGTLGSDGSDALWMTYRLYGWWFAVSSLHGQGFKERLAELVRGRQTDGRPILDASEPLLWAEDYDLRLSSVLNAFAACPDLATHWAQENGHRPWHTAISSKSIDALVSLASGDVGDEPHESPAMDWVPPFRIATAALSALLRNGGKFTSLPQARREAWLSWIPLTEEEGKRRPQVVVLQVIHFSFVALAELSPLEGALLADRCLRSETGYVRTSPITAAALAYAAGRRLVSLDIALDRSMPHIDDTPIGRMFVPVYLDSVLEVAPERAARDAIAVLRRLGRDVSEETLLSVIETDSAFDGQEPVRRRMLEELSTVRPNETVDTNDPLSALMPEGTTEAREFMQQVIALAGRGAIDAALDLVYDKIDELVLSQRFSTAAEFLQTASRSQLPISILVGFLTITLPWHHQLTSARRALAELIRTEAMTSDGEEKADALLRGLI